jgi:hypothetical protein
MKIDVGSSFNQEEAWTCFQLQDEALPVIMYSVTIIALICTSLSKFLHIPVRIISLVTHFNLKLWSFS